MTSIDFVSAMEDIEAAMADIIGAYALVEDALDKEISSGFRTDYVRYALAGIRVIGRSLEDISEELSKQIETEFTRRERTDGSRE